MFSKFKLARNARVAKLADARDLKYETVPLGGVGQALGFLLTSEF
jgi:hypothetical protein